MPSSPSCDLHSIFARFAADGDYLAAEPYGSGHINDTYRLLCRRNGTEVPYLLQRINHRIFTRPLELMDNISRVTTHLQDRLAGHPDAARRALRLIPARDDGAPVHRDGDGNWWRMYDFIVDAHTHDVIDSPEQAYQAAYAFGLFQRQLADLPGGRLHETIPNFHHTPARFANFARALAEDPRGRACEARAEIAFALAHEPLAGVLLDLNARGEIPERVTHNDTKINNVMLDDTTGEGICVIDLDTVMPGLALYDFGDLVRTSTSPAAEDETDLAKVVMQMPMYEALVVGYLKACGDILTPAEKAHLAFSGKLITLEIGVRFLTDFLQGDVYFKTKRPCHNLDRCRTQFALVADIERQEKAMNTLAGT
jgi:hypothetical protein